MDVSCWRNRSDVRFWPISAYREGQQTTHYSLSKNRCLNIASPPNCDVCSGQPLSRPLPAFFLAEISPQHMQLPSGGVFRAFVANALTGHANASQPSW